MYKNFLSLLAGIFLFSGCAYYQPFAVSTNSIGSQYERPSGIAEGVARRYLFFPCYELCPVGEDSLKAAIDDALVGRTGDALSNVYVDRKTIVFPHILLPLFVRTEIIVTGTLVKYNTKEFPPDLKDMTKADENAIWDFMLTMDSPMKRSFWQKLDYEKQAKLDYLASQKAKNNEINTSDKRYLFELATGIPWGMREKPKPEGPKSPIEAVSGHSGKNKSSQDSCSSYDCLIFLDADKQKEIFKSLPGMEAKKIINNGRNKIKACFPEKAPSIVTAPETMLLANEKIFLEFLCQGGFLSK